MRVAIIGGGLTGLTCAYELKKNGIIPVIFEKNCTGAPLNYAVTALSLFYGRQGDPLRYFREKYGVDRLIGFLGMPVVKQTIYNNPFSRAEQGIFAARIFNALKGRA